MVPITDYGSEQNPIIQLGAGAGVSLSAATGLIKCGSIILAAPGSSSLSGGQILPDWACFIFGTQSYAGPGAPHPGCITVPFTP